MQLASFVVADGLYAVPVLMIEEFFRPVPVTNVPLVSPLIEGLIHLRGKTATVLNLRRCLDKPEPPAGHSSKMILLVTESGLTPEARQLGIGAHEEPVALRIDGTSRILTASREQILPPPAHIRREFISGVIRGAEEGQYIMLLDIRKLIAQIIGSEEPARQGV